MDKFYIGHTGGNVNDRLKKHLTEHDGFTAKSKDWQLVFTEVHESKALAYARELQIKGWKSKKMIQKLIDKHSSTSSAHPDG